MQIIKSFFSDKNIKKIILIFIITRILLIGVGLYARRVSPNLHRDYDYKNEISYFGTVGTMFHGWDSEWYLKIAKEGYSNGPDVAFYPLYPLTIKTFGFIFGDVFSAILISNTCLLFSGIFLYLLLRSKKNEDFAYKAVKYLFIFPTSFIFSAILTESLFMFLLILSFFFLEKNKFALAGVVGFLLSLTRPVGFLIFIPITYFVFISIRKSKPTSTIQKLKIIFPVILPILGVLSYVLYLHHLSGNLTAIFDAEKGFGKSINFNFGQILGFVTTSLGNFNYIIGVIFGLLPLVFVIIGLTSMDLSYSLIVIPIITVYLMTTTMRWHILSIPRYFSVLFPVYVGVARIAKESKFFDFSASVVFLALQIGLFYFWTRGFPTPI